MALFLTCEEYVVDFMIVFCRLRASHSFDDQRTFFIIIMGEKIGLGNGGSVEFMA